ncbi:RE2 [Symbiodinium sp. CCMP2592]|nr:RE2 [Symbiodinium sp. CCMP2592]
MAKMKGTIKEAEITLAPSSVDGSLWYIMAGPRRVGMVVCYVDDLLIVGEKEAATEVAAMFRRTWKCTEPQWDDVSFNGFEVKRTEQGLLLTQNSYTKDLLERYKDMQGYEEVPAPLQVATSDFELQENETAAEYVRAAQVIAGEVQWLAGRCRPEIMYATNLLSQAISRSPKEAVYRGGHLIKYLKRFPEAGLLYSRVPVPDKEARHSGDGPKLEGYSDASFAPSSERSQQCVLIFAQGGLVAWSSSRQPFVTMSTAESELVAICELVTCLKSVEQLMAEIALGDARNSSKVTKVLYSDSQSALSVCRCAAGSWRTRHLRIRGSMVRELLDQNDWLSYHVDGVTMTADIGTKSLAADRFNMLADRMRMKHGTPKTLDPQFVQRLLLILCVASLVDQVEAADEEEVDFVYYGMMAGALIVILTVYEFVKWVASEFGSSLAPEHGSSRGFIHLEFEGKDSDFYVHLLHRGKPGEREEHPTDRPADDGAYSFVQPTGDRDRWELDYDRGVAIRWHAKPRQQLFVPGHCTGGPELSRLTGERTTYAKFANGNVRVASDNYLQAKKPAQILGDREWKGYWGNFPDESATLRGATLAFKQSANSHRLRLEYTGHSIQTITPGMLHDSTTDAGDFPVLTLKAWNSRIWLAYMDHCIEKQLWKNHAAGVQDREMVLAGAATRNLVLWFCEQEAADRFYLTESQAATIHRHACEYLKYAQALAKHASGAVVLQWKILPKHHAFDHLAENVLIDRWNPRGFHAFMDEDLVLQWKRLALQMPSTAMEERRLIRYLIRLSLKRL